MGVAAGAHLGLTQQRAEHGDDVGQALHGEARAFLHQFGQQGRRLRAGRPGPQVFARQRLGQSRKNAERSGQIVVRGADRRTKRFVIVRPQTNRLRLRFGRGLQRRQNILRPVGRRAAQRAALQRAQARMVAEPA